MISTVKYARLVVRAVRPLNSHCNSSIKPACLCKYLSTTRHVRCEDDPKTKTENVSYTVDASEVQLVAEGIPKESPIGEKEAKLDLMPKILEDYFKQARCHGCGMAFQSEDPDKPGYVIKERNPSIHTNKEPDKPVICRRCFHLKHYNMDIGNQVFQDPSEVSEFLSHISRRKGLILYVVDLLDLPGSMVPDLLEIVGPAKRIIVVANKIDILPRDGQPPQQIKHLKTYVMNQCRQNGLQDANIKDVCLVSAVNGYGMLDLVHQILDHWDDNGDLYLIGSNNTGKTTLFNAMLDLTNVQKKYGDMLHRATASRLPGTTLTLLRMGCSLWKLRRLKTRLYQGTEEHLNKMASREKVEMDPTIIGSEETSYKESKPDSELLPVAMGIENKLKRIKPEFVTGIPEKEGQSWLYDTPGIFNHNHVTNYLTLDELTKLDSKLWLVPRTYVLRPGQAFLLGGLARVDYNQITRNRRPSDDPGKDTLTRANQSIFFTIFAPSYLPIHVLNIHNAEYCYNDHAGHDLLKVPIGGDERMKTFPPLKGREFIVTGIGWKFSGGDIVLSNIGWVAVTAGEFSHVHITAHTPNGTGLALREPAFLRTSVNQRAKRGLIYQGNLVSCGYEGTRKRSPRLIDEDFLRRSQKGVYQWYRESKRMLKEQRSLIKMKKMEKTIRKSLEKGRGLLDDVDSKRSEALLTDGLSEEDKTAVEKSELSTDLDEIAATQTESSV